MQLNNHCTCLFSFLGRVSEEEGGSGEEGEEEGGKEGPSLLEEGGLGGVDRACGEGGEVEEGSLVEGVGEGGWEGE